MRFFAHEFERCAAYIAVAGAYAGGMNNDGMHKFAYRRRELFADLLRLAAPALAAELDFAQAEELPTAYAELGRDGITQRFGDMAWRIPRRYDGEGSSAACLVAVVEFQSTVKQCMAQRMRDYSRMARERLAVHGDGPAALLPLVLYNGSERWTAPGAATGLAPWSTPAQMALAPFQGWDYVLLSLEQLLSDGSLAHLPLANRAAATLRLQAERTPSALLARLRQEWGRFLSAADAETRRVLHLWTGALLADMGDVESAPPVLPALAEWEGLEESKGGTEMATVSQARLGQWFEQVRAEHVAEGMERGIEQGIEQERTRSLARARARGLAWLQRQAAIRFGAPTAERLSELLGAAVAERMESLEDQVSEWIVECEQGEELLSRVSALVGNGGTEH